jgi:LAO/AO transport system kinase
VTTPAPTAAVPKGGEPEAARQTPATANIAAMAPPSSRSAPPRRRLSVGDYADGVVAGDRAMLGRAITLVESRRPDHQELAQELLAGLLPHTGGAQRVGVTGVPGVGKSTLLENLGSSLTGRGHRVAVLAVDPTSALSGGSILGDKTRMARLAADRRAFIRPSPSGGSLGGVARKTREAMLLCEAAGYDVVLVETVGTGQSEVLVAGMVDFLLLLLLPGAGDELQGIKRGILERVDLVAVNKADGASLAAARDARSSYLAALKYLRPAGSWRVPVVECSGLEGTGLDELWDRVEEHRRITTESGEREERRRRQRLDWLRSLLEDEILGAFHRRPEVVRQLPELERRVMAGELTPAAAARRLLGGERRP